ncbi:MAG TPA: hypothetical protein VFN61_09680 [Acidimicrobiales bacterium]|nr:hypothetical protein [Acidimicrobiales bacterium]
MTAVMQAPRNLEPSIVRGFPGPTGPDPTFSRLLLEFLRDFNSVGKTVLMSRGGRLRIVVHADTGSVSAAPEVAIPEPPAAVLRVPPFVASLAES